MAGGAAVGLLLVIGGGAFLLKGGKKPDQPANTIETPANNSGNGLENPVGTIPTNVPQLPKTDVTPEPQVVTKPEPQSVTKTEPKVEERPVQQTVVTPEPQVVTKTEPKVEEKSVQQTVVKTEPKAETTAATATTAAIQAKIVLFGAENEANNALLKGVQQMAGAQNTTFHKAGLSSRAKGDLMKIQSAKPDLMLIAVTSRYETMSLSNFELFVADLCEGLRSRGGNYAFVLEPIADQSARFCSGNNTVRDVCRQRSVNVIDCEDGEIKLDDVKMLLNQ